MASYPVDSVLYLADSYKVTHHLQYPPHTTFVYSYFESRGGKFAEVCFFGLQYLIKRWLVGSVVTEAMVQEAKEFYTAHFMGQNVFNEQGWMYIVEKHGGRLPLRIKSVPEGSVIPVKNVLFTIENTDPNVPWLTNWFETLLVQVWYPTTVCTNSRNQKLLIGKYLYETSGSLETLPLRLHDFGYRGSTSIESAGIGDAAHLVNFASTDTVAGLHVCRKFYHCKMAATTIPASEHSTMTAWGRDFESDAYKNMLDKFPDGPVSVVSDSYDIFKAVDTIWGGELKNLVMKRTSKNNLVIRPDSGDPAVVLIKVLDILSKHFPCTLNAKGYKVLPDCIRILQGDGVCYESLIRMLEALKNSRWSVENVSFGTGGALLQKLDRDTQKFAMKCSMVMVNGLEMNVNKQPVTDSVKISKKGRLTLEYGDDGAFKTTREGLGDPDKDLLVTIFENGSLLKEYTLEEIRHRADVKLSELESLTVPSMNGAK